MLIRKKLGEFVVSFITMAVVVVVVVVVMVVGHRVKNVRTLVPIQLEAQLFSSFSSKKHKKLLLKGKWILPVYLE